MAKQFGLITPNKDKIKVIIRPSIFDDDSDSDGGPAAKPTGLKKTLKKQDKITQSKAVTEDPTVYQYDEIYDAMDQKRKESKLSRKDLDKKPKYISRLLQAAEKRKKDNERRIERQVQKEREAEGEEFKDKESFVTTAYRKKLEEMKEEEELEKREEYLEAIGDVTKQGNLDGFYRHLYEQKVKYEDVDNEPKEIKQEADDDKKDSDEDEKQKEEGTEKEQTDKDETTNKQEETKKNRKRKYRQREQSKGDSDDEATEQVEEVKKEHLPSNLDADSDFSIDSSDSEDEQNKSVPAKVDASKNGSEPTAEENKDNGEDKEKGNEDKEEEEKSDKAKVSSEDAEVAKEETKEEMKESKPKKPKIDIWKKRTVGEAFDAALMRYFERKSLRQL